MELADLVAKLDLLTHKKPAVELSDQEKAQVAKQLEGLEQSDRPLSEQEAKTRLERLLGTLDSHKEALEKAGFRSPPPAEDANPFKNKNVAEHLKSLQKAL
jgi:hypothetical protein